MLLVLYSYYQNSNRSSNIENTVMENADRTTQPNMVIAQDTQYAYSHRGDIGHSEQFFARQTTYAACDIGQS